MHQCGCGNLYSSCGHRAPTVKRDAANTFRSVASDPLYGKATGGFWALCLIVGIGTMMPPRAWAVIGIIAGIIAFLVILGVILNRATNRRVKVDTRIY